LGVFDGIKGFNDDIQAIFIELMNYDLKGVSERHLNNMRNSPVCGTFGDFGGRRIIQKAFGFLWV